MEYNLEQMTTEIVEIKSKVETIGVDVHEMKSAILGNRYGTEKGVIHTIDAHAKKLDEFEKKLVLVNKVDDHESRIGKLERNILTQTFIKTAATFVLGALGFKLFESLIKYLN